VSIKRQVALI